MPRSRNQAERSTTQYYLILFQQGHSAIDRKTVYDIQVMLDEVITTPPAETNIDVWIESPGGDAHATYKLVLDLRHRCQTLQAVVPDYAKSAATLLVLGVDKIFMAAAAELGPLDIQIEHPDREGLILSALDVADSLEFLSKTAIDMVIGGGGAIVYFTKLRRTDVLEMTLKFMAQFLQPTIAKLDPHLLHQATNQLQIAERYAINMLQMRNNIATSEESAKELMDKLIKEYPSHEYVISRNEARALGLPVVPVESYHKVESVKNLYTSFMEIGESLITVVDDSMLDELDSPQEEDSEQESDNEETRRHTSQEAGEEASPEATDIARPSALKVRA